MRKILFALAMLWTGSALAAPDTPALVVTACGTPPEAFFVGRPAPLTVDTNGNNCTNGTFTGTVTANSTAKATAAAPSYGEGTDQPFSQTLTGSLRTTGVGGSFPITAASGAVAPGAVASGAYAAGSIGSGAIASGAVASGAYASGAYASGSIGSGAIASGAVASGAYVAGSMADGALVTLGAKADAKSTATDTTAITIMQVLKEISAMVQAPASTPVTNVGTFAVQAQPAPVISGGLTLYNVEPAAGDNHVNIKNGAGQVYHIAAYSKHTAAQYMRLYNAATGFNGCGSATNLVWSGIIPGASTGAGFVEDIPMGLAFSTGISICVTGAYGQADTTNATASVMEVNVGYK